MRTCLSLKRKSVSALLAALLSTALMFTACPSGDDPEAEAPTVTGVTINPQNPWVVKGGSLALSATVTGKNNPAQTVTWSITEADVQPGTGIDADGLLTVNANEARSTLTVKAASTAAPDKVGITTVSLPAPNTGVIASVEVNGTLRVGQTLMAVPKDAEGGIVTDAAFQWLHGIDQYHLENIAGATSVTYTLVQDDLQKRMAVEAKNSATAAAVRSLELDPVEAGGENSGETIISKGVQGPDIGTDAASGNDQPHSHLYWLDPKVDNPGDYTLITGFTLHYTVLTPGKLGGSGEFPCSVIMAAKGARTGDDFIMDYTATIPAYRGEAEEIATYAIANGYLGPMVFLNCTDGSDKYPEPGVGSKVDWTYTGTTALFDEENDLMTVFGIWGDFEVTGVEWIKGSIAAGDPTEDWDPVAVTNYADIETVPQGTANNGFNYIDITVPANGTGPFPVVFWVHGGGWSTLTRKSVIISDTKQYMLYKGYAWVSAEYTLAQSLTAGDPAWPQMVKDLKLALRWLRAHGGEYNLDTSYVVTMGESAGGHLALLLGTTNKDGVSAERAAVLAPYEDTSTGWSAYSSDVQGMVSYFGGIVMLKEIWTTPDSNPVNLITEDSPPVFLTHGENDRTAPIQASYSFENRYKELKGSDSPDITTLYYTSAPHGSRAVFDSSQTMARVKNFIIGHNPTADYGIADKRVVAQWKHNTASTVSVTFSVDGTFFMSGENQGTYTLTSAGALTMNITTLKLTIVGKAVINADGSLTISGIGNQIFGFLNGTYTAVQGNEGGIKIDDDRIYGVWEQAGNADLGTLTFDKDGYCTYSKGSGSYAYTLEAGVLKTNYYTYTDQGNVSFTDDNTLVLSGFNTALSMGGFKDFNGTWTRKAQ